VLSGTIQINDGLQCGKKLIVLLLADRLRPPLRDFSAEAGSGVEKAPAAIGIADDAGPAVGRVAVESDVSALFEIADEVVGGLLAESARRLPCTPTTWSTTWSAGQPAR
jgi:hypothetical protein